MCVEPFKGRQLVMPNARALLALIQIGDQEAMASLYDLYSQLVYSIALRILRDSHCAEDIVQDVFMQIWRWPERFIVAEREFSGWMTVVTRNRSIDILRSRRPSEPVENLSIASYHNLSTQIEQDLMFEKARVIMAKLSSDQQRVLQLAYFEGMSQSEIAEMLQCPLGTVKTRVRSAILRLRKGFENRGADPPNVRESSDRIASR